MASAMLAAHYPLQALLYCVALHRYLRWRLPGYDPDRHIGPDPAGIATMAASHTTSGSPPRAL